MKEDDSNNVKKAVSDLLEKLGTVGLFMLSEVRALLRRSWGASQEEFNAAVDKTALTIKESGKMAAGDVEMAAERIKNSWRLLNKEKDLDWELFRTEIWSRLAAMGEAGREAFDLCVNQAREVLAQQKETAVHHIGEERIESLRKQTDQIADSFKTQLRDLSEQAGKAGRKIDRTLEAAWREFMKKD